jgi:Protein of unknown function (DUF2934)
MLARKEGHSLFESDSETLTWDEERFERLLRLAASLQGSLPGSRQRPEDFPSRAKIESRAYEIYLRRGATHGRALDDWLSAEQEVLAKYGENDPRLRVVLAFGFLKGL